jgi:PhnB protein
MQLHPYLIFDGDCEAAFKFYEKALGGKIEAMSTFAGSPAAEHAPPEWGNKILHATMRIGDALLMASDSPPGHYSKPAGIQVAIVVTDPAEGEKLFQSLSENGSVQMPYSKTFWSPGFGMCVDQFGIPWMVNCESAS